MNKPKSYNANALMGLDVDDMEFVTAFDLPIDVAYTPDINVVMLDKVYTENLDHLKSSGMSNKEAHRKASAKRTEAEKTINDLLARAGMLKGKEYDNDGD